MLFSPQPLILLSDPEVTANLYCNFAYLYGESCVICSINLRQLQGHPVIGEKYAEKSVFSNKPSCPASTSVRLHTLYAQSNNQEVFAVYLKYAKKKFVLKIIVF